MSGALPADEALPGSVHSLVNGTWLLYSLFAQMFKRCPLEVRTADTATMCQTRNALQKPDSNPGPFDQGAIMITTRPTGRVRE